MVVAIAVQAATQRGSKAFAGVLQREHAAAETAIHTFLAHQAGLLAGSFGSHHGLKGIFLERACILVLLIVAITVGIVQRHIQFPQGAEGLVQNQLVVGLAIDIFLILVEARHLAVVLDFAVRVICAVVLEVVAADAVPSVVGIFLAAKGDEAQRRPVVEIAQLSKVAHQFAAGTVTVTIAADMGQASLDGPVVAQQAGTHTQGLLVGIERAVTAREIGISITREALGTQVHAAAKGA